MMRCHLKAKARTAVGCFLPLAICSCTKSFGPGAMEDRLVGVLKEALMDEVWPAPAPMDPVLVFAAPLGDRSNATVLLDGGGALVTGAITAEGAAEPWGESGAGAGEAFPDRGIGMGKEELRDARVVLFERSGELE